MSYKIQNNKIKQSVYDFQNNWDKESIKKAIANSKNEMPNFNLSKIEIHPSGSCNQKCKICYGRYLAPKKRTNLSADYTEALFLDIRKNLADENPLIILSGLYSEPLANPEIKEIIEQIIENKFRFGIYTNGLLINDQILELLGNIKVDNCFISFNVTSSLLSGDFEKLEEIVKNLKIKTKNLQINTPLLVMNSNYVYIKALVERLISAGSDSIRLSTPWPQFNSLKKENRNKEFLDIMNKIAKEFPEKVKLRYDQPRNSFKKCYVMAMTAAISPEGDVYPCPETCTPVFSKLSYGNIKKNKFSEIWHGTKHREIFKEINPEKTCCRCCPVDGVFNEFCSSI